MARVTGCLVVERGKEEDEVSMVIEFSSPDGGVVRHHRLREEGYFMGRRTRAEMIEGVEKAPGATITATYPVKKKGNQKEKEKEKEIEKENEKEVEEDEEDIEVRNVESQCSTKSSSKRARLESTTEFVDFEAPEVLERSRSVVKFFPVQVKMKGVRSVGRAPGFGGGGGEEEEEIEISEVDEYVIFGDGQVSVSVCVLPMEFEGRELIGGGAVTSLEEEVWLLGKSGGSEVMRSVTAWKLVFPDDGLMFHILVKITHKSGAQRWVKLESPRPGYKETAEEVFSVAKFLAVLKKEPYASEDKIRSQLLEGDVFTHVRKQCSLIEQYINLDPALKETEAQKTLRALTRENGSYTGKRMALLDNDSFDEDDNTRMKKRKTDHTRPDDVHKGQPDVRMPEYESEEDLPEGTFMDDKDDESENERGESLCIFCDDGGYLLCCDGPCMRSFHPRREDGTNTPCKSLGYPDGTDIVKLQNDWLCKNCELKKHQCFVCGELGDSEEALGPRRQVYVCDVASCGKFYHPACVAAKLKPTAGEIEALVKGIRAGEESFTCPLHTCKKCGKGEEKKDKDLNLATCRRCPKAWHVKCLPRTLSFVPNEESHFEVRAWHLGKQFIVYCSDHEIVKGLSTPRRNHIKFPEATKEIIHIKGKIDEAKKIVEKPQKNVSTVGNELPGFGAKASASAVSSMQGGSASAAQPTTQRTPEDATKRFVDDIVAKSEQKITKSSVSKKLVISKLYRSKEYSWMERGRVDSILKGARAAVEKFNQNNAEDAKLKCAVDQVTAITSEEDRLKAFLSPTLFGNRYTSFGRHFTKTEKLQKVVEALQPYIQDEDTIVDFSCGDNSFFRLLYKTLANTEKSNCKFKSFDVFPPKDTFAFERKDWLNVTRDELGRGENLVIGLNPPFAHAEVFVSHALVMEPRVLVLIVPPLKKLMYTYGYVCLVEDRTIMAGKSFFLPGSVHRIHDEYLEQGSNVAPCFYIYAKGTDLGASKANSSAANPSQQTQQIRMGMKAVRPAKPTSQSEKSDKNLDIPRDRAFPPTALTIQPRPTSNRMSEAVGPRSQVEEAEILPPPPPGPPPPHQPSVYHERPPRHVLQFPPYYRSDAYDPLQPDVVPPGHPRGLLQHDPGGLSYLDPRGMPYHDPRRLLARPFGGFPSTGFRPYHLPGLQVRNVAPPWPQNQQFHHAPPAPRGPVQPRGRHPPWHEAQEYGGWLPR